ncbi:MAG: hypothetical protein NT164_04865 [Verrucomicrobiae bacterium]|nr:hypothetical protein [Verrucomicrobiae bacterium]
MYRDTRGREHRSDAAMCGYNFFENALSIPMFGEGEDPARPGSALPAE